MIPAMIGAGKDCESYYENLPPADRQVLLNLVNKTTIPQLGALLKSCAVLISADTGTAHFALALDVPVVDVFYLNDESNLAAWGPKTFYRHRLIARGGDSALKIFGKCAGSDRRKLFPVTLYISGSYQERILICSHGISRIAIL